MEAVIDKKSLDKAFKSDPMRLQLLPCSVETDGPAKIEQYFETTVRSTQTGSESKQNFTASFRGRPLKGMDVQLPSDYTGVVLEKGEMPLTDEQETRFNAIGWFPKFRQWNLDYPPSSNDTVRKAMTWLSLAEAVHGSVDDPS
eukprot:m.4576 g.4576  ORF g.4576 m.4576 type:complete len:143 (+) comp10970_c0_seq2:692-1120(+)